jgi:hypothetical protein
MKIPVRMIDDWLILWNFVSANNEEMVNCAGT